MWLVRIALSRPYTFIVLALIILITGILAILRTPTDIFPSIDIPVIGAVWNYSGLPPDEMANRITSNFERAVTTTVNNIEHIESESLISVSVIKLFFQANTNIALALSEVTAISQTMLKTMPPGVTPPLLLVYDASTVPIMQIILSSTTQPEQKLNDIGNNFIRTQLATIQGAALPYPYGGKVREIIVDLNPLAMQTYEVSAQNVNAALNSQSLIIPAGTQKIGPYEYLVKLNNSTSTVEELNNLPVKASPTGIIAIHDVAHVRDGFIPQTNIVRVNGDRAIMMSVQKTGDASTLNIIDRVKALLPYIRDNLPAGINLTLFGDQSIFVTTAIKSVLIESIIAAALTSLSILLFLGSWPSPFIIVLSIPLSMLASISMVAFLGQTINIMTLGGLALAVGILVDDATVTIENINWNLKQKKDIRAAIIDGAQQISIPALVSTLCICIVFIPMFFLGGVAQYLFVPFAEAVIFAMLASYFLSRTLVPTLAMYLLSEKEKNPLAFFKKFQEGFEKLRQYYQERLRWVLQNTRLFIAIFMGFVIVSLACLWPWLGSNFFPVVDAGQIKLHIRAPTGTRVEETANLIDKIDAAIRTIIPPKDLDNLIDNIGLPYSGINLTYSNSATAGPEDADILISLKPKHQPIETYIRKLRQDLQYKFPGIGFSFLPADIVNQILNFGLPSPINLQIVGSDQTSNLQYAYALMRHLNSIPGIVDVRTRQAFNYPELLVNVDRNRALELGFTQLDIASDLLISLSGSFQTSPNFWVDPQNGVSYPIITMVPQYAMNSLQALNNIPLTNSNLNSPPEILGAVATIKPAWGPAVVSHYNVQPVIDIFASIQDRDLGSVTNDIQKLINKTQNELPKGSKILVRGQMETQQYAFTSLYLGLAFSILLIYLLIVVNFQSWLDPFIIITALPAALAGIAWTLFITQTTLSVPALTGAIMSMGVATANSILVISFAKQQMLKGHDPFHSALEAGVTRLRPVLMTALAMIIGMLPIALGIGEGSEQNAPLGRAVIGGLSFATVATLFFVPAVFCIVYSYRQSQQGKKNV